MTQPPPVVFLLEVDNTLLHDDRVIADCKRHLPGPALCVGG